MSAVETRHPLGLPPKQMQMTKEKIFEQIFRKARVTSHTPDPCCRRVGGFVDGSFAYIFRW